jgi:hypothetical protein
VIGVVRVQTLDATSAAGDSPGGSRLSAGRHGCVTLVSVPLVRRSEPFTKPRVSHAPVIHAGDATCRLDPIDAQHRKGTAQPVAGRKRGPIIEKRRHTGDHRDLEVAPDDDVYLRTQRPAQLGGDYRAIIHR